MFGWLIPTAPVELGEVRVLERRTVVVAGDRDEDVEPVGRDRRDAADAVVDEAAPEHLRLYRKLGIRSRSELVRSMATGREGSKALRQGDDRIDELVDDHLEAFRSAR